MLVTGHIVLECFFRIHQISEIVEFRCFFELLLFCIRSGLDEGYLVQKLSCD